MKSVYLCGSMSGLRNFGAGWRKKVQSWLETRGEKVFNPVVEEGDKPNPDWESLDQSFQEAIIKKDLNQVINFTKYIICYYTQPSTGTVSELSAAFYNNIPCYFVKAATLKGWPRTVSKAATSRVFKTFNELFKFLGYTYYSDHVSHHTEITKRSKGKKI